MTEQCSSCGGFCKKSGCERADYVPPEQDHVAWRNAAIRVGEDLCSVGPFGYYDMTAAQWLDWALSVVTVHAPPQRTLVLLTTQEVAAIAERVYGSTHHDDITFGTELQIKLKEKNQ